MNKVIEGGSQINVSLTKLILWGLCTVVLFLIIPNGVARSQSSTKFLEVEVCPYPGNNPVMWDGVYAASNGKVYSGLITEGASAHLYEYDAQRDSNVLLYDMAGFLGTRGKGIRTPNKIHNRPVEDNEGNIYFTTLNGGGGPRNIDPLSWEGGHWMRYRPETGVLENLGLIDKHIGIYALTIDKQRNLLYGVGFNGYFYRFDIKNQKTTKFARVSNWSVSRSIFCDDQGNVYGSFPVASIWKYDAQKERVMDLDIKQPYDPTIYPLQLINPMIDLSMDWRRVEWDPYNNVAYGITCGSGNILFRFDPHQGMQGKITALTRMCDPKYWGTDRKDIPYAPLAFAVDSKNQKVYFVPSARQYSVQTYEESLYSTTEEGKEEFHHLIMYDIASDQRIDLGRMITKDGRRVFACEGATVAADGTVYIVGQVEVNDKKDATLYAGKVPLALHLIIYKP
jgi:hypothetical protein